jgi:phage terminase small subunit
MTLTEKQQVFVAEYLIDLNATKAAIRAGYNAHRADQIGYENLRKPEIQKAIKDAMNQRAERTQLSQDWIIQKLQENVERAMAAVPVLTSDGQHSGVYTYNGAVANKALELLGKHKGMFVDRQLVGSDPSVPQVPSVQIYLPDNGRGDYGKQDIANTPIRMISSTESIKSQH